MKIGCVAWGSLVWAPGSLPLQSEWFPDGPCLAVEFARFSRNSLVTLVIVEPSAERPRKKVPTLWALLSETDLWQAREALATRERIITSTTSPQDRRRLVDQKIGCWPKSNPSASYVGEADVASWFGSHGLDYVVWTALGPRRKDGTQAVPDWAEIRDDLHRLRSQDTATYAKQEQYVRRTLPQIRTPYRDQLEADFGWIP